MKTNSVKDQKFPCKRYGKTYYRRPPSDYHDASTPIQQLQRGRLAAGVAFWQTLRSSPVVRIWKIAAQQKGCSGYNLFMGNNMNAFAMEGYISDYTKITLSAGTLSLPDHIHVMAAGENEICIRWHEVASLSFARKTDRLMVAVIYSDNSFEVCFLPAEHICRDRLTAFVPVECRSGCCAHLYVFFRSEDSGQFSAQRYFEIN